MNEAYEQYTNQLKKRNRNRFIFIFFFALLTIFSSTIIILLPVDPNVFSMVHLIIVSLTTIGVFAAVVYPWFKPIYPPQRDKTEVKTSIMEEYTENIRFPLVIFGVGIFTIVLTVVSIQSIYIEDTFTAILTGVIALFFWLILLTFNTLRIWTDENNLFVKMGPGNDKYSISDIVSVRSVGIRPIKDFLGYGKRIAVDGTIGYITGLKTGVRIELSNGKKYVITSKQPQKLVEVLSN